MEERERKREMARERECKSSEGERGVRQAKKMVEGGTSEGAEGDVFVGLGKALERVVLGWS